MTSLESPVLVAVKRAMRSRTCGLVTLAVVSSSAMLAASAPAADRLVGVCPDRANLCEADPATGVVKPITTGVPANEEIGSPSVSTDGTVLAFRRNGRAFRGGPDPASATKVTDIDRVRAVSVNPDGEGLSFRTFGFFGSSFVSTLGILPPGGGTVRDESTSHVHEVAWLGREPLDRARNTAETICVFKQGETCWREVATLPASGLRLSFPIGSPDAKQLVTAVSGGSPSTSRIVLFDPRTRARVRDLTQGPSDFPSSWSPDGTMVSFTRGGDTWAVPVDGSALPRLLVAGLTNATWGRDPTADTTAPQTTITAGPSGSTSDSTPTFEFSSSEAGSTFTCRIDAAAFTNCSSPHTTAALSAGAHTFEVRARDAAGNVDPTPASRAFTVDAAPPQPDGTVPVCLRLGVIRLPLRLPPAAVETLRRIGLTVTDGPCR